MFDIHEFDEVTSTNDVVKEAIAQGEREGFAVVARTQTGGYGRRGNSWSSPGGNLYISFLLEPNKPPSEVATLGMVAALAVRNALARFVDAEMAERIQVKWPNDVVVQDRADARFNKICGISTELIDGKVCLGIGIDIAQDSGDNAGQLEPHPESAGKNKATYLEDIAASDVDISIEAVRDALTSELTSLYSLWQQESFSVFASELNAHDALSGRSIRVSSGDDPSTDAGVCGVVRGIADDGALMLEREDDGEIVEVYEGTISLQ